MRLCAYIRTLAQLAKVEVTQMPYLRSLVNWGNGYRKFFAL